MDSIFVFYYFSLHIISAGPEWQMRWLYSRRERTGLLPQKIENEERKIKIALCRFSGLFYLSFFPPPSPFLLKKGKNEARIQSILNGSFVHRICFCQLRLIQILLWWIRYLKNILAASKYIKIWNKESLIQMEWKNPHASCIRLGSFWRYNCF